jgi:hypothetical protein
MHMPSGHESCRHAGIAAPCTGAIQPGVVMSIGAILLILLILILVGVLPTWPHSSSWGYGPSGLVGVIVIVVVLLWAVGGL